MPGARHLLIGLDGAGLDIVRGFGAERLPELHRCLARGACAALRSVQPPATLPNWITLLTGDNPGRHGVFDFTTRRGYRVRFSAGSVRATPTLAARMDRAGLACACLFFPGTFPPERLQHGVFASGWDSPVAFEADRSFVWPPQFYDRLRARFGPLHFDDVDEFDAGSAGFHGRLPDALCARIERRAQLGCWLLGERAFELFAIYFGESDTAAHHLWPLHDAGSPRRPAHVTPEAQSGLLRVYQALDRAVGKLLAAAGGEGVELSIVSDHGSGGASDKVLYLNRALAAAGFLRFRPASRAQGALRLAKDLALTRLPPAARERLFRAGGAFLPSWLESRARFSSIDMRGTRVFSDELNYFPALHFNLRGREPQGQVAAADRPRLLRELADFCASLRDPWNGQRVVERFWPREELYTGPHVERAPDVLLELALSDGYSYNLMPSASAPPGAAVFRKLEPAEYLGRKGRSLPGSHRARGVFIACGPSVAPCGEIDAAMADVSATLLARARLSGLHASDGRVLSELLREPVAQSTAPAAISGEPVAPAEPLAAAGEARVAARLRRLGYIE
ncbi:MAG TPA: alkaline phosphatase family protein [Polyangiales bacterium]|nr:alkaline phosphatase family protein [Polyangiales bacterium]